MGRMILEAVTGIHGDVARDVAQAWVTLAEQKQHLQVRIDGLEKENASLKRVVSRYSVWEPVLCEIDRRAEKEHCLEDECDFTVTVTYEEYAAIDKATQAST